MRVSLKWLLVLMPLAAVAGDVSGQSVTTSNGAQTEPRWLDTIVANVTPLKNDRGDRLPMIMWHDFGFGVLHENDLAALSERGLCQHLQLSEAMIPAALAVQEAGLPVILMEGRTDSWPYSLAEDASEWSHDFDLSFPQPWFGKDDVFEWHGACPHKTAGWEILERQTRLTLEKFRDAGVTVNGVWMDFEGDPYPWSHLFDQMQACRRCRVELPADVIGNKKLWRDHSWQRYVRLYDQHFAKPVREVFPDCLVTNWHVVRSTRDRPVRYFVRDTDLPELNFQFFNTTNPIGYASDVVWQARHGGASDTAQRIADRFFIHEVLQQVSTDAANRGQSDVRCVPWVARVCKLSEQETPIMSRPMYREALRHLWLRGIATMQIFNPVIAGHERASLTEVQDAVMIYDEMLAERDRLADAEVMNLQLPSNADGEPGSGVLWSGMRSRQRAVIRMIALGQPATITVECWPGQRESLEAKPEGTTYRIERRSWARSVAPTDAKRSWPTKSRPQNQTLETH